MTEEPKVWVEIKDTIERIDEALKLALEPIKCQKPDCPRTNSIEFDLILRDSTKIDTITGLAPKVRHPTRMCKPCLNELREELVKLQEQD